MILLLCFPLSYLVHYFYYYYIYGAHSGDSTNAEYTVSLTSRQLGMTIENVMERTVVRAIHANSDASRLGVKTNSVILKIGSQR